MKRFVVLVVFLLAVMAGCSNPRKQFVENASSVKGTISNEQAQLQMPINIDFERIADTEANRKIVNSVYSHFMERVQGNSKIEKIDIIPRYYRPDLYLYRQEDYGWQNEIEIIIKISNDDKTIYEGLPIMRNNLFYYFGGGKRPGMVIQKDLSAYFYGLKKAMIVPGEDTFVVDDFYKIIDGLVLE